MKNAVLVAVSAAVLAPCVVPPSASAEALPLAGGEQVLWIGNSLVGQRHGAMGGYTDSTLNAGAADIDTTHYRISYWGQGLQEHFAAPANFYADASRTDLPNPNLTAHQYIQQGFAGRPWDVVVLQDYNEDFDNQSVSAGYIRKFVHQVRAAGAQPVLMARWYGHFTEDLTQYAAQQNQVQAHYDRLGAELDVPVVPLAAIWAELTLNPPKPGLDKWWLYTDAVHPEETGKAASVYAFYSMFSRQSPVGVPLVHGGYNETNDPVIDAGLEQAAWNVIQAREPWATDPAWTKPQADGTVTALVDEATGQVKLQVTGDVTAIQLGTPSRPFDGPLNPAGNAIAGLTPVQAESSFIAWLAEGGTIAPGTHDLGLLLDAGTTLDTLFVTYTTASGTGAAAAVQVIPEPASMGLLLLTALAVRRRR